MSLGTLRKAPRLLALVAALPLCACKTGLPFTAGEHWTVDSVPDRMMKQFTGYRADRDGNYRDYQFGKKRHLDLTFRRHFFSNSPDDPFEADDPSTTRPRPTHSFLPDPLYYMGAESVVMGIALLGVTGTFVPIPLDSVLGTVLGGVEEFDRGMVDTLNFDVPSQGKLPPGSESFRVKNK